MKEKINAHSLVSRNVVTKKRYAVLGSAEGRKSVQMQNKPSRRMQRRMQRRKRRKNERTRIRMN